MTHLITHGADTSIKNLSAEDALHMARNNGAEAEYYEAVAAAAKNRESLDDTAIDELADELAAELAVELANDELMGEVKAVVPSKEPKACTVCGKTKLADRVKLFKW